MHRKVDGQNVILNQTDHPILGFLVKLLWHELVLPTYSDGTKPRTLHTLNANPDAPDLVALDSCTSVSDFG